VTDLFGLHWRGPSQIVAPLRPGHGSILAQSTSTDREQVVIAELDLARLRDFRAAHAPEFNRTLLEKSLPRAYEQYRERTRREGKRSVR
jgi:predicted amidohydrolase